MRNFPTDLCLSDWLDEHGYAYDVITDPDLHALGAEALDDHDIVLTGSHPEYVSGARPEPGRGSRLRARPTTRRLGSRAGCGATASAISFLGSLSHNDHDNSVSRLLANVLGELMRRPGKRSVRERVQEIAPS